MIWFSVCGCVVCDGFCCACFVVQVCLVVCWVLRVRYAWRFVIVILCFVGYGCWVVVFGGFALFWRGLLVIVFSLDLVVLVLGWVQLCLF